MKTIIYLFFGTIALSILAILSAIGGIIGAGTGILAATILHNIFFGSVIGGLIAAWAFHRACQQYDTMMETVHKKEQSPSETAGKEASEPSIKKVRLAKDNKHLWGSASYCLSTILGVNLIYGSAGASVLWTIIICGLIGILCLALTLLALFWKPLKAALK
ncbi:MAG: hypothetical protein JST01_14725 [Cyanobacteria bacterium SZAS TMP-1]|nr:hypothetical protein [Cyanobacteria bacterium SZAS TMP-1]